MKRTITRMLIALFFTLMASSHVTVNGAEEKLLLRSEPVVVSKADAQKVFGLSDEYGLLEYIENQFEDQDKTVIDHRTGVMWQKSGSERLTYEKAQEYVKELNRQKFAGYDDWRLPTIPELMSLIVMEPEEQASLLYINPIFDAKQFRCWSADRLPAGEGSSSGAAWFVSFSDEMVGWDSLVNRHYVRCVRSRQD